jgi:hypothetical protein
MTTRAYQVAKTVRCEYTLKSRHVDEDDGVIRLSNRSAQPRRYSWKFLAPALLALVLLCTEFAKALSF